ncbi:O-antigen polymerase [Virgibacillus salexigens]|uniref:O-antigen polymerase n=1 Tax=Virgibacillus TaxID=84406 RepID=UPI0013701EB5|nr:MULTISPECIES: O-antigen polymerase [Virgibacillus]MYL40672.1 hypothetical protein [Virgibacillus massiliensis]
MGIYSTIFAVILGFCILINEFTRKKDSKPFDLLSGVNLLFFLSFVVTPLSIYFFNLEFSSWTFIVDVESGSSFKALFYVLVGYLSMLFGLSFSKRWKLVKNLPSKFEENNCMVEKFAHIIGVLGISFLLVFIFSVGGVEAFLSTNTLYRSGSIDPTPLAFVRNLALFIPISCFIFYGLSKNSKSKFFNRYQLFFIIYFVASLLLYFNRASRMGVLVFLISFFILNVMYYRKNILKYIPLIIVVFLFLVYFGKSVFNYFFVGDVSLQVSGIKFSQIIGEFSFPFYTLTHAMENSFFNGVPRLFFDFLLGFFNLLPSAILPFSVPMNATQLNTESFLNMSGIPIDLVSLGFYSFGISGVILITFFFGITIGCVEKILSDKNNLLVVIFYIQFIFFFSLIVPYASPTNVYKSDFCLLFAFLIFIYFFKRKKNATNLLYKI